LYSTHQDKQGTSYEFWHWYIITGNLVSHPEWSKLEFLWNNEF